jgi:hypothetical protein
MVPGAVLMSTPEGMMSAETLYRQRFFATLTLSPLPLYKHYQAQVTLYMVVKGNSRRESRTIDGPHTVEKAGARITHEGKTT